MRIELYPVVCWLTQDTDQSYEESLDEIIRYFRAPAERYIENFCPVNRKGYDHVSITYLVLKELQKIILDQYLPELEPDRTRAVSCVWPHWVDGGMAVKLKDGRLERLKPPLPADESRETLSEDGSHYPFTFYRNDHARQRRRWVHHLLREMVRNEREREHVSRERPLDDAVVATAVQASFEKQAENSEFLEKLRRLAPDDFDIALSDGEGENPAERKRRQRAMQTLFAAGQILNRRSQDAVAQQCADQLAQAADAKERKTILTLYYGRYCNELWRKVRKQ